MPIAVASSTTAPPGGAPRTMAALSLDPTGHPVPAPLTPLPGFRRTAIAACASAHLSSGSEVVSDGLACFAGVGEAACGHLSIVVGARKPKDPPGFLWVNRVLGNDKTCLSSAYHAFAFGTYAERCLGAIACRFNPRCHSTCWSPHWPTVGADPGVLHILSGQTSSDGPILDRATRCLPKYSGIR
jgi:hypothetical protein